MLNDNEKTPWSRINAHKSFKDNPVSFDRVKLYRTIHDPVVHYVLGRPGAEPNLLSFINSVFEDKGEPPVRQLSILNPFDAKTYLNDKQTIVDILAEDENHRKFNIEFQVWNHKFFIERCLYYWARLYSHQLLEGQKYEGLNPVVSIILTDFQNIEKLGGLFPSHSERIHTSFGIRSNERPEILLTDHLRIHFLQLPKKINAKALAEVHPQLANWLTYFGFPEKTTEVDMEKVVNSNSNVASAYGAYCSFHLDPELRIIAENCERFRLDAEAYADSREEQGEIKGEIKGKIEGEIKGKIDSLIHILTKRLGPLPDNIMTKITALKDLAEIDRLADIALDVPSLEQFMNYFN